MRTTQIGDCNFVSDSWKSVTKGKIFKSELFDKVKLYSDLMAQFVGIIVCAGLTKTH